MLQGEGQAEQLFCVNSLQNCEEETETAPKFTTNQPEVPLASVPLYKALDPLPFRLHAGKYSREKLKSDHEQSP